MTEIRATNITWHEGHVTRDERAKVLRQRGATLWFTGLSGSGKSTIAFTLEHALVQRGRLAYVLDGDNIRHGLNKNLGFSAADREENIRRIGEVAKLFADCGVITMTSFISPYRKDRDTVRALHDAGKVPFIEVHVNTPIATCEQRDPKGLYKKARAGELKNFTGIDDPYEAPLKPELTIDATGTSPQQATVLLLEYLEKQGIVSGP
jgi:adenylylsulfate kinase